MTTECPTTAAFRKQLTRSVILPLLLLCILAATFLCLIAYLHTTASWVDHTDQVIAQGNGLLRLLVEGETGVRGQLLTGDQSFLEPYYLEEAQSDSAFEKLSNLVSDNPAQVARLATLRADQAQWRDQARLLIKRGYVRENLVEGKHRMDGMRAQIAGFIRVEEDLRDERTRNARTATWVVAGVSLGMALLLGGALAGMAHRQLVRVTENYRVALASTELRAESLRKSALRLEALHDIDRAILAAESMSEIAGSAVRRMEHIVPGDPFVVAFDPALVFCRDREKQADPSLIGHGEPSELDGPCVVHDLERQSRSSLQEYLYRSGQRSCVTVPLDANGRRFGILVLADPRAAAFSEEHRQVAHEIARQLAIAFQHTRMREQLQRHAADLERKVEERTRELQDSLGRVKQLQGLLPICAWCKKVRDGEDYWHHVEHYISEHTDARFSHGICPACMSDVMDEDDRSDGM